ncbi:hypothetical protein HMPREF3038_00917 [Akkermansia sp. KLE1797]|nr:hypothetical protein HMPREF3038_00917 [Akkermansia sp. KLE1797]KXU54436.1 hypothetical protein HMPREF3039_01328 [Akkermansia sp. KLE1798]KZA04828.1 hypothetical protein HMPREF1326_01405 [Akkermansia sp. KLE1605]
MKSCPPFLLSWGLFLPLPGEIDADTRELVPHMGQPPTQPPEPHSHQPFPSSNRQPAVERHGGIFSSKGKKRCRPASSPFLLETVPMSVTS